MNVLMFKGQSTYSALRFFADCLEESLIRRGHNVFMSDMLDSNFSDNLKNTLNNNNIHLAIDFNGVATTSDLSVNNVHICELLSFPLLSIYVDHPAIHIKRLQFLNPEYSIASFIDKNHVKYAEKILPNSQKLKFFLPHGGKNLSAIETMDDYKNIKNVDILFSGGIDLNAEAKWEKSSSKILANAMRNIANLFEKDIDIDFDTLLESSSFEHNIYLSPTQKIKYQKFITLLLNHYRNTRRLRLVKAMCKTSLNITVCGDGWGDFFEDYKNVTYRGSISLEETIKLMSQSKILVHNNIDYSNGSHERVFNAMLNNTFVFTDRSKYYDEFFENGKDIAYYKFASLDEDIKILHELLKDDEKLFEMTKNPKQICQTHHTWDNRAKTIEEICNYIAILDQ